MPNGGRRRTRAAPSTTRSHALDGNSWTSKPPIGRGARRRSPGSSKQRDSVMLRRLTRGFRVLARRAAADRELDEEVAHYHDEATADRVAAGQSPDEAQRSVRLEYGTPLAVREDVRASGWEYTIGTTLADLRYALRGLRTSPGFAAVVALTLALGIGATTAIFSAVKPVLFDSLPYPNADRVAVIWDHATDGSQIDLTFGTYREIVQRSRAFDAIAAMKPWQPTLTGAAEPERLEGQRVSAPYFQTLGVRPATGRDFEAPDDRPDAAPVVVISDGLWRRRFAGDPSVVGRNVVLNDARFTVVGIMPVGFENVVAPAAEIWAPLQYDPALPDRKSTRLNSSHLGISYAVFCLKKKKKKKKKKNMTERQQ